MEKHGWRKVRRHSDEDCSTIQIDGEEISDLFAAGIDMFDVKDTKNGEIIKSCLIIPDPECGYSAFPSQRCVVITPDGARFQLDWKHELRSSFDESVLKERAKLKRLVELEEDLKKLHKDKKAFNEQIDRKIARLQSEMQKLVPQ